jgi:enoyl-[acyl-carrier protein] reductase I
VLQRKCAACVEEDQKLQRRAEPGARGALEEAPAEIRENKRYKERGDFSLQGVARRIQEDFGSPALDIVVHSLANGPEVKKPLLETSRKGYLEAVSVSAYSNIALIRQLSP